MEHPDIIGLAASAEHYFNDGRKSAAALLSLVETDTCITTSEPWTMLEFASGYGCVTHHFDAVAPEADVTACDIHGRAVEFIQNVLSTNAVISVRDPDHFWLRREFDIVFALSFFSHMPASTWSPWLKALFRHVRPGGSLIFTTHGHISRQKLYRNMIDLDEHGFWFEASSEQADINVAEYGTTITSTEFVTRQIFAHLRAPSLWLRPVSGGDIRMFISSPGPSRRN
ncbi:MAG: class I SAM-dependent methyltransferase [Sphingomonas sp.]